MPFLTLDPSNSKFTEKSKLGGKLLVRNKTDLLRLQCALVGIRGTKTTKLSTSFKSFFNSYSMLGNKLKEADKLYKEAKGNLSTGLLKWKPNFTDAAPLFEQAAVLYKQGHNIPASIDSYAMSGDSYYKMGVFYLAGKNYENAGNVAREAHDINKMNLFFSRASKVYMEDGKIDRSTEVLTRLVQALQKEKVTDQIISQIINIFYSIIDTIRDETDKYYLIGNTLMQFNTVLLNNGFIFDLIENFRFEVRVHKHLKQLPNCYKAILSIVVCCLLLDDPILADEAISEMRDDCPEFEGQEEGSIALSMIEAFKNGNLEEFEKSKKSNNCLKFLEPALAKKAIKMTLNNKKEIPLKKSEYYKKNFEAAKKPSAMMKKKGGKDLAAKKNALLMDDGDNKEENSEEGAQNDDSRNALLGGEDEEVIRPAADPNSVGECDVNEDMAGDEIDEDNLN